LPECYRAWLLAVGECQLAIFLPRLTCSFYDERPVTQTDT
jgi:hypothetical protein